MQAPGYYVRKRGAQSEENAQNRSDADAPFSFEELAFSRDFPIIHEYTKKKKKFLMFFVG